MNDTVSDASSNKQGCTQHCFLALTCPDGMISDDIFDRVKALADHHPFRYVIGIQFGGPDIPACSEKSAFLAQEVVRSSLPLSAEVYRETDVAFAAQYHPDFIRLQSYSLSDWPLLEEVAALGRPVVASVDGITSETIDRVVSFFNNREIPLLLVRSISSVLKHAVPDLTVLDILKTKHAGNEIGCSMKQSEFSSRIVCQVMAHGATFFELLQDATGTSAAETLSGSSPALMRGAFARYDIFPGDVLTGGNIYFEKIEHSGQLLAEEWSKYCSFAADGRIPALSPVFRERVSKRVFTRSAEALLPGHWLAEPIEIAGVPCIKVLDSNARHCDTIIFVHGGGYVSGSSAESLNFVKHLALASSCMVVSADYRLAPEHPFPASLLDLLAVYRDLSRTAAKEGGRIGFYGESAGGGLVLAAVMQLVQQEETLPAAVVCSSPWADLTNSGDGHSEQRNRTDIVLKTKILNKNAADYAGGASLDDPMLSPVNGSFSGFPPMLVFAGLNEILYEDSQRVAARACEEGVDITFTAFNGMPHVFTSYVGSLIEADRALTETAQFFKDHFSRNRIKAL